MSLRPDILPSTWFRMLLSLSTEFLNFNLLSFSFIKFQIDFSFRIFIQAAVEELDLPPITLLSVTTVAVHYLVTVVSALLGSLFLNFFCCVTLATRRCVLWIKPPLTTLGFPAPWDWMGHAASFVLVGPYLSHLQITGCRVGNPYGNAAIHTEGGSGRTLVCFTLWVSNFLKLSPCT
jgi:hypothetical protein